MKAIIIAVLLSSALGSTYAQANRKPVFHLNFRPGLDLSGVTLTYKSGQGPYAYGNRFEFRAGAEAELLLPGHANRWALVVEPAYRSYSAVIPGGYPLHAHYEALQLLAGIRYYLMKRGVSAFYITASAFEDVPFHSSFVSGNLTLPAKGRVRPAIGAGYRFIPGVGMELRYEIPGNVVDYYEELISGQMKTVSLLFSCGLF